MLNFKKIKKKKRLQRKHQSTAQYSILWETSPIIANFWRLFPGKTKISIDSVISNSQFFKKCHFLNVVLKLLFRTLSFKKLSYCLKMSFVVISKSQFKKNYHIVWKCHLRCYFEISVKIIILNLLFRTLSFKNIILFENVIFEFVISNSQF